MSKREATNPAEAPPATKVAKLEQAAQTSNRRVRQIRPLISPALLLEELPITAEVAKQVEESRKAVKAAVNGEDDRLVCIVGPCSIHDPKAALEYAEFLAKQQEKYKNDLIVVMRVYFEKPRTTVGWKGLINDPALDGSFNINSGLRLARKLLLDINKLGLPVGTEFLDSISPQFTSDLVSWGAIGARTTESQIHRELASGLSMPIGFKNGTGGSVQLAVDAIGSAANPHSFLGVTEQGLAAIVSTSGNDACHIILRGGSDGPNYSKEHVTKCKALLDKKSVKGGIIIDCSHGNSKKIHTNQPIVASDVAEQLKSGTQHIVGVMVESNLVEGKQSLSPGKTDISTLKYGLSVTDACINLSSTEEVLESLSKGIQSRREATKTE